MLAYVFACGLNQSEHQWRGVVAGYRAEVGGTIISPLAGELTTGLLGWAFR